MFPLGFYHRKFKSAHSVSTECSNLHFLRPLSQIRHVIFTFWDPYHRFGMWPSLSETPITQTACGCNSESIFWDPYLTFCLWPSISETPIIQTACSESSESLRQFSETPIALWARTFKTSSVFFNFRYDRSWINFLRPLSRFRPVTFNFWDPCHLSLIHIWRCRRRG